MNEGTDSLNFLVNHFFIHGAIRKNFLFTKVTFNCILNL